MLALWSITPRMMDEVHVCIATGSQEHPIWQVSLDFGSKSLKLYTGLKICVITICEVL